MSVRTKSQDLIPYVRIFQNTSSTAHNVARFGVDRRYAFRDRWCHHSVHDWRDLYRLWTCARKRANIIMPISLIIFLLTYLLSASRGAKQSEAIANGLAAGALTYGVSEYTQWGQENLQPLNDRITTAVTGQVAAPNSAAPADGNAVGATQSGWSTLSKWGPGVLTAGAAAVAGSSLSAYIIPGMALFAVYLFTRK